MPQVNDISWIFSCSKFILIFVLILLSLNFYFSHTKVYAKIFNLMFFNFLP